MAEGGCLCGAVRYRVEGPPLHAGCCHCRMCQRAAGAPVVAWGGWPAGRFAWSRGKPKTFASSARGERSFCPTCGASLTAVDPGDRTTVEATLASLDDPAAFPPQEHIWTASRVPWLEIGDGLPRHPGGPGSGGGSGAPWFCRAFQADGRGPALRRREAVAPPGLKRGRGPRRCPSGAGR